MGLRLYQLQTVWQDGRDMGGASFYFEVMEDFPIGDELERLKAAAKEFLLTEEGKEFNKRSCGGNFGWGDILEVPDAILLKYGMKKYDAPRVLHSDTVENDGALFLAWELEDESA